jgi:polysaccharide export outer membrane protein
MNHGPLLRLALLALILGAWADLSAGDPDKLRRERVRKQQEESQKELKQHALKSFENVSKMEEQRDFVTPESIQSLNNAIPDEYLLGPGDVVEVQVWDQPELSGQHLVGPSGRLSLPLVGEIKVEGKTRAECNAIVQERLSNFYKDPLVNFRIVEYHNNRVYVLGRVSEPGVINFRGRANLLEALSMSGAIPVIDASSQLTKCAIIRGKSQVIWVDLQELLYNANMSLNLRLANNDVVFIPDSGDALIYVMGEVGTPGAYRVTTEMSFLDALMLAGGITEDGIKTGVSLIRANPDGEPIVLKVDMTNFEKGDFQYNVRLRENDIIYVRRRGLAHFNWVLRQINPFTQVLLVQEALSD